MSVEEKVKKIIEELWRDTNTVGAEDITADMTLCNSLGLDSLDMVEMVMKLEDEFDIVIKDEVVDEFETVADVVFCINAIQKKKETDRVCEKCGCTENDCSECIAAQNEPCYWVAPGKCSRCFDENGNLKANS